MNNIYDLDLIDLEQYFLDHNEKKYRAKQLFEWLYLKRISDFSQASNLSKKQLEQLKNDFVFDGLRIKEKQESKDGTIKYLFELYDGNLIETVLMKYDYGNSICVSSQVGCNMSCRFCASGQLTKQRDLSAGEMVAQIIMIQKDLDSLQERVSHLVVMGIGEPFDNYDNVMKFVKIVNNPHGLAIGARHITISTCGLIAGINRYQEENLQTNLAISLHSAADEQRSWLMPINKSNNLAELKKALQKYYKKTKRRITFEYIVLKGVNDSQKDAKKLADYCKGLNVYVNLIPYNQIGETEFKKISRQDCFRFYDYLKKLGVNVTIRKEFGSDIDAACGQLRSRMQGRD